MSLSRSEVLREAILALLADPTTRPAIESRLWPWVSDPDSSGCRTWSRATSENGYGVATVGPVTCGVRPAGNILASRLTWLIVHGPIPPETPCVLHHCDNPPCCEPSHLYVGTLFDNARDMSRRGRQVFQRHPEKAPAGIRNGRCKLSPLQVEQIRERRAAGDTNVLLAADFGVGTSQISRIYHRKEWVA